MERPSPFRLDAGVRDGIFVIVAAGEIDLENATALPDAAARIDGTAPGAPVLVDLSEVRFIDSSGLRGLLEARRRVDEEGHPFALLRPSPSVRRMLELVDLLDEMPVVESTAAAEIERLR